MDEDGINILSEIDFFWKEAYDNSEWKHYLEFADKDKFCDSSKLVQPDFSKSTTIVISELIP